MSDLGSSFSASGNALVPARGGLARRALPLAMLAALALAGCGTTEIETPKQPPFYENLAKSGQPVNAEAAASIISDYRMTKGLNAVTIDPALNKVAQDQADAMARADTLSHEVGGRTFVQRMNASGYGPKVAVENVGAGYHTLAEAFSGWRDSPPHNKNMLASGVTRMGIATAFNPKSKYKVYWALVLATPDDKGR
ncbi:CAP domain-containing protein [Azorhizobium doebereinerae]|uniref:CAP domain-containing protein n=1 Tax=Azorhizobium doebereinerae TaxID=281091 RepID=UPI001FD95F6E|nr:CAP domain-containing protein [Azorhizobium doebereinerae]